MWNASLKPEKENLQLKFEMHANKALTRHTINYIWKYNEDL